MSRGADEEADARRADPSHDDVTRRTSLASERTFLAWWRTGLAAFVVALGAGGVIPDVIDAPAPRWPYVVIGCGFAIVGAVSVVYGMWRGRAVERAIERGDWLAPSQWVTFSITALLVALGIGLIALLILTGTG